MLAKHLHEERYAIVGASGSCFWLGLDARSSFYTLLIGVPEILGLVVNGLHGDHPIHPIACSAPKLLGIVVIVVVGLGAR